MKIFITVDLGFGDSGKGTIVDALVRKYEAPMIVRFNGGSQAAHSVYSDKGVHHSFNQFGSTFKPNVYTFLSRYMLVNPLLLEKEAVALINKGVPDPMTRLFIDERALMVTPYHRAVNRLRELARGHGRHGSCGAGIGECMAHAIRHPEGAIRMGDLHNPVKFQEKLLAVSEEMHREVMKLPDLPGDKEVERQMSTWEFDMHDLWKLYETFYYKVRNRLVDEHNALNVLKHGPLVFEAAQGVLLDENYGFHPYTTWSTTTTKNARLILEEAEIMEKPTTIGIMRSYMTRHGAGPMPTEDATFAKGWKLEDTNNPHNAWQHGMRFGPLDLPLLRYAIKATGGVDCLAITHMDKVTIKWPVCVSYETPTSFALPKTIAQQEALTDWLENVKVRITHVDRAGFGELVPMDLETPIGITSYGPGPLKNFHALLESKVDC